MQSIVCAAHVSGVKSTSFMRSSRRRSLRRYAFMDSMPRAVDRGSGGWGWGWSSWGGGDGGGVAGGWGWWALNNNNRESTLFWQAFDI